MSGKDRTGAGARDARGQRLAEALRDNLRRRKGQARARRASDPAATDEEPRDDRTETADKDR